jgi:predicted ArsR family transcriptional regulator
METIKIASTLADPTRHGIYEYIYTRKRKLNVQEIATAFSIHPNVARMHLNKLEDVGVITSESQMKKGSGRPGKIYSTSKEEVTLQLFSSNNALFTNILLETLESLGEAGIEAFIGTGKKKGSELTEKVTSGIDSFIQGLDSQPLNADIFEMEDGITLRVFNCPFGKQAHCSPMVCKMHNEMLKEWAQACFGEVEWKETANMKFDSDSCDYEVRFSSL